MAYQRPALKRLGSFRELTQSGWNGLDDGWFQRIDGNLQCSLYQRRCS
jgi:hypothetical protein